MRLHSGWLVVSLVCACAGPLPEGDGGLAGGAHDGGAADGGSDAGVSPGAPHRVVFAFDAYPSTAQRDPTGQRGVALRAALDALPQNERTSVLVMAFVGTTTAIFSPMGLFDFTPITALSSAQRDDIVTRMLTFQAPGTSDAGVYRDFVKPLSDLYSLVHRDTMRALTRGEPPAVYTVIFVSDGTPNHQDDALLCHDAVSRLRWLTTSAEDVKMHTVHVYLPAMPIATTCGADAGLTAGTTCALPTVSNPVCPIIEVELDAQRLDRMARLGGGRALSFRAAPVDFTTLVPR